jgi:Lrp/AsnC family leucine-responsive transcriptional regulator
MPTIPLDRTDLRILDALQADGRLTNQELAERVALSPSPCLRRVRRLEEAGVIRQYVALLEPRAVGLGLVAYVNVKLEKRPSGRAGRFAFEDFRDAVQGWPEVMACYAMTGDIDYLMRVHVADLDGFSRFVMAKLLKHPGVVDVRSSFALDVIKDTTALPIGGAS